MPSHLTIRLAAQSDKQSWNTYVLTHWDGLAYQLFAWKEAVEKAYGFDCPYFLAELNDRITGILPTCHIHWPFRPGSLVSLPYCDAAGILADDPATAEALLSSALAYVRDHRIPEVELRFASSEVAQHMYQNYRFTDSPVHRLTDSPSSLCSMPYALCPSVQPQKVRLVLPLPGNSEVLLASFKSKLRSQVKKPIRDGLTAVLGGSELLDDFYPVFCENMRDIGSPVHSRAWIDAILAFYDERALCAVVYLPDETPAACGIILLHERTVSIPWASSLKRFNRFNPNMLLYWSFLEYAAENGYSYFDFGRSTPGEGTYRFKEQWGAIPHPLHWIRVETADGKPMPGQWNGQAGSNGKGRAVAGGIIGSLPVSVATSLGSRMRKYISL